MATSQPLMWKVLLEKAPKGKWLSNQEIYRIIEDNIQLQSDDFEPAAATTSSARWQRNVRNIFQYRKNTGELIWSGDSKYLIPDSSDPVAQISSVPTGHQLSDEAFERLQQLRKKTGQLGEEYVLSYEKKKLTKANRVDLATKVKKISSINVSAGYDIESFEPDGTPIFIEVKTSSSNRLIFEITSNEIKVATKIGQYYYLYLVRDIYDKPTIKIIKNLSSEIGSRIVLEPSSFTGEVKPK